MAAELALQPATAAVAVPSGLPRSGRLIEPPLTGTLRCRVHLHQIPHWGTSRGGLPGKPVMSLCAISGYVCLTWCGCGERAGEPELSESVTELADAPEVPPVTALVAATLQ